MGERYDNISSRDGSFGWDDVKQAQERGQALLNRALGVLVEVARGEKSKEDVEKWLLIHYPVLIHYPESLSTEKASDLFQELYEEENLK